MYYQACYTENIMLEWWPTKTFRDNLPLLRSVWKQQVTMASPSIYPLFPPQHTEPSRRKTAQRPTRGTTVRKWVECTCCLCTCSPKVCIRVSLNRLLGYYFSQGNGQLQNGDSDSRHASLSEEEENLAVLRRWGISRRSFISNQITRQMDCVKTLISLSMELWRYLIPERACPKSSIWSLFSPLFSICLQARDERAAGNWEGLRWGAALRIAGASSLLRLFNPFCLPLEPGISPSVSMFSQGYASEMDNPAMVHLIPAPLQNKKEVLFGNMPEIYHFHKRWRSAICLPLMIPFHMLLFASLVPLQRRKTWCSTKEAGSDYFEVLAATEYK